MAISVKEPGRRWTPRAVTGRLEFLEIGTNEFDTLLGSSYPGPGKSVEALKFYQDKLPDRTGVEKVNAAVVGDDTLYGRDGAEPITFYFVHPANISRFKLPPDFKGMSSVAAPNPQVAAELRRRGLWHLLESAFVPTTSYVRLVASATSIGFVKLDIEGGEPGLMRDLASECRRRKLCPDRIQFEHKWFRHGVLEKHLRELRAVGYTCTRQTYDARCSFDEVYAHQ